MADLAFTETLLNHLESSLCIDTDRVFITGHSWGGDMAHVVACFLGDRVAAAAPAAAADVHGEAAQAQRELVAQSRRQNREALRQRRQLIVAHVQVIVR